MLWVLIRIALPRWVKDCYRKEELDLMAYQEDSEFHVFPTADFPCLGTGGIITVYKLWLFSGVKISDQHTLQGYGASDQHALQGDGASDQHALQGDGASDQHALQGDGTSDQHTL